MTETKFLALVDYVLTTIEKQVDQWMNDLDIDVEASRNGNVLDITFDNGIHVVINSQAAVQELWVAAKTGGFHYRFDGQQWLDTRGGPALPDALSRIFSDVAGQALRVSVD